MLDQVGPAFDGNAAADVLKYSVFVDLTAADCPDTIFRSGLESKEE